MICISKTLKKQKLENTEIPRLFSKKNLNNSLVFSSLHFQNCSYCTDVVRWLSLVSFVGKVRGFLFDISRPQKVSLQ